ncbi:MAG: hypothetical protein SV108_07570, partial [Pseudomonadota bacterium]|nr:hypothetical protein [Pseudomonadota bacterium]
QLRRTQAAIDEVIAVDDFPPRRRRRKPKSAEASEAPGADANGKPGRRKARPRRETSTQPPTPAADTSEPAASDTSPESDEQA